MMTITTMEENLNAKSKYSSGKKKKRSLQIHDSSDESDGEDDQMNDSIMNGAELEKGLFDKKKRQSLQIFDSSDESGLEDNQMNDSNFPDAELEKGSPEKERKHSLQISDSSDESSLEDNQMNNSNLPDAELEKGLPEKKKRHSLQISDSSDESGLEDNQMTDTSQRNEDLKKGLSTKKEKHSLQIHESSDESDSENLQIYESSAESDMENDQLNDAHKHDAESEKDSSSSEEEDDDAPPIRIFRNKNAAAANSRGYDSGSDMSEDENCESDLPNAGVPETIERPRRRAKAHAMPKALEIKSETQRLIRESRVNLPYHVPEAKKLSQFLKRPIGSPANVCNSGKTTKENKVVESVDEKVDSGVEFPDLNSDDNSETKKDEMPATTMVENPPDRKSQLLALSGIVTPSLTALNSQHNSLFSNPKFIELDSDEESSKPSKAISNFMERFLKHSKIKNSASKKKVQFNIIKKEERADGSGIDLVPDVVTHSNEVDDKKDTAASYKTLREKLTAKMKQRRSVERKKRQELYKLDNEEVGSEHSDEEEEEDFSDRNTDSEDEEMNGSIIDDSKNHVIEDDDEEDDDALEPTQLVVPEISNASSLSKASQHTIKSDTLPSNLVREDSMLLFEDTTRKASCSREGSIEDQSFDPMYSSTIPPNKSQNIDSIQKPPRMSTDDDSYFCSGRSINLSNHSTSRHDYESLFLDSDGFIKESKLDKSINSLLPPGGEDDNANDCNMSQLLELCSGKFQVSTISPHGSDMDGSNDVNGGFIDESFGFQVEADTKKDDNFGDFSDHVASEDENEDNGITIIRKKKDVAGRIAKNFLEDEAELSGDDVGSEDEDEDAGENNYESDENDEQLPKEEIIHQQVNKVHLKQVLDEDQRDIDLLQEAFVTETFDVRRNRKFKWKNIDDNLTPDLFHSDDENENPADDVEEVMGSEESQWRMLRLKREEYINSTESENTENVEVAIEEDSQLLRMGRSAIRKSRILSEINEDSRTNSGSIIPPLTRSTSLNAVKLPKRNSFLARKPEVLSKFANFKEVSIIKGAVNSDRMVFKVVSPSKKNIKIKRVALTKEFEAKRPRLDDDSNSIFNLFEM